MVASDIDSLCYCQIKLLRRVLTDSGLQKSVSIPLINQTLLLFFIEKTLIQSSKGKKGRKEGLVGASSFLATISTVLQ